MALVSSFSLFNYFVLLWSILQDLDKPCCAFALSRKLLVNTYKTHPSFPFQIHPKVKALWSVTQHTQLHAWVEPPCDILGSGDYIHNSSLKKKMYWSCSLWSIPFITIQQILRHSIFTPYFISLQRMTNFFEKRIGEYSEA